MKLTKTQVDVVLQSLYYAAKYETSIADAYGFSGIIAEKAIKESNKYMRLRKKLKEKLISE